MTDRLIELALESLQARKAAIEAEMEQLKAQMKAPRGRRAAPASKPSRGPRSAAARKAQSERMKLYWAKKRAEATAKGANKTGAAKKA